MYYLFKIVSSECVVRIWDKTHKLHTFVRWYDAFVGFCNKNFKKVV